MYYSVLVILCFIPTILCNCNGKHDNTGDIRNGVTHNEIAKIKMDSVKYVILPIAKAHSKEYFRGRKDVPLSCSDFFVIDKLVRNAVQSYNDKQEPVYESWLDKLPNRNIDKEQFFIKLPEYKRQYFCTFNNRGEKIVWVNCFCGSQDYWETEEVFVFDGGNCYFHMMINLNTKQISNFGTNGVA